MSIIDLVVVGFVIGVCVTSLWMFYCNKRTFNDKCRFLNRLKDTWERDGYTKLFNTDNAVTYSQHFWYICTFRDPWKLYPNPELIAKVRKCSGVFDNTP